MAPPGWSPSSMRGTAGPHERVAGRDVEAEGLLQEAGRRVEQRPRHGAAHVVHDDVEPAELVEGRLGQRGHEVEVGQVARHHDGTPAGGLHLRRHLAQLVLGPGGQHDVGARLGQRHGGGGADAAPAGGDDGDLVGDEESIEDHPRNVVGRSRPARRTSVQPGVRRFLGVSPPSGASGAAGRPQAIEIGPAHLVFEDRERLGHDLGLDLVGQAEVATGVPDAEDAFGPSTARPSTGPSATMRRAGGRSR